jgi:hypothetical protein
MNGIPWWHLTAEKVMFVGGIAAFLVTLHWVRSRDLREKYAILWLGVALALLIIGLFPRLIMVFANLMGFGYAAAALFLAVAAVYAFAFAVSASETAQFRRTIRLSQELAILEQRLRRAEAELAGLRGQGGLTPHEP